MMKEKNLKTLVSQNFEKSGISFCAHCFGTTLFSMKLDFSDTKSLSDEFSTSSVLTETFDKTSISSLQNPFEFKRKSEVVVRVTSEFFKFSKNNSWEIGFGTISPWRLYKVANFGSSLEFSLLVEKSKTWRFWKFDEIFDSSQILANEKKI